MRQLAAAAGAVLGTRLGLAQLVELELTQTVRVALCRDTIEWNGKQFIGGRMVQIGQIKDQGGEIAGLTMQISGVPADMLAVALGEPVQGKTARVWTAIFDAETLKILDVMQAWAGTCDTMPITQSGAQATIAVTAEHRGVTFARPKGLRYTDGDQQALYPGDASLRYIVAQATHQDVWPAAAYFQR